MLIEVCAQSIESSLNAQKGGAWRIELCQALELGGLTPSPGLIQLASQYLTIPVHVLIRPRPGDFVYSRREMELIRREIELCKTMGVDGVVIGMLTPDLEVDVENLERLVDFARPMDVTFHRAFDTTPDLLESAHVIRETGCHRILTSGGAASAIEGIDMLSRLNELVGEDIAIMAGKGVNADNIPKLAAAGISQFHLSGQAEYEGVGSSDLFPINYFETEVEQIKAAKEVVKKLRSER